MASTVYSTPFGVGELVGRSSQYRSLEIRLSWGTVFVPSGSGMYCHMKARIGTVDTSRTTSEPTWAEEWERVWAAAWALVLAASWGPASAVEWGRASVGASGRALAAAWEPALARG